MANGSTDPGIDVVAPSETGGAVARLAAELAASAAVISAQGEALAHFRKLFERASEAARIGVWQCDLPCQTLTWTDMVYDLFELPRGIAVTREMVLPLYPEESRARLRAVRDRALAERSGFQLDVEIRTARGAARWIRITATVECDGDVPVRIFGMKQDITEERLLADRLRHMAESDAMTGLASRARFQSALAAFDAPDDPLARSGVLMIVDLDGFKQVNDGFGHAAGDACLRRAADRLAVACRDAELVARIGGDEFAVIWRAERIADPELRAARIASDLAETVGSGAAKVRIGASIGIARADGRSADELFRAADDAMYRAKAAGRGTYRTAPPRGRGKGPARLRLV
ncbi:diguanylate cyclase domain-containing protein [Oharaeibacter diazotrophicus]|uniref:Diguanylate cyclase (GGDEF)-like protein n=1 Tax=Oharaeibacter diazotrophicus TaxID=1920512 RepID=A0A4R6RMM0_9HYPH|nr:diguanylate cyclase [Oharaeibacter diazotrophicus]TDP87792.1 diguanylate cyclase (GGDEF)-like protein [Oharaeibacter diazotrophicus]BBE74626.1 putative diguanylate cyclase YdaM [Pleomorphomonas sp. SM30]GLS77001.1 hypothetical protein GCM10007904_23380 [Oharaeibacter diazotrophicus]